MKHLVLNISLLVTFIGNAQTDTTCLCKMDIEKGIDDKTIKLLGTTKKGFMMPGYTGKMVRVYYYHKLYKYKATDYTAFLYSDNLVRKDQTSRYAYRVVLHVKKSYKAKIHIKPGVYFDKDKKRKFGCE